MFSQAQLHQYRTHGYTVYPGFLDAETVETCLAEIDEVCRGQTLADHNDDRVEMEPHQPLEGTQVRRVYDPCTHYPLFRDIAESDTLMRCVEQLLGPDIYFGASKINVKPAKIGSVVRWHQDFAYGPLSNTKTVTVLFYLDDTDLENGCLQVLPGRHEGPLLDHTRDGFFQGQVTEPINDSDAVPIEGRIGTGIFLHCMTPHASVTNQSPRPRRTLIAMYRAADAYPLVCGPMTVNALDIERLVRGKPQPVAKFSMTEIAMPRFKQGTASLYQLQEEAEAQK